MLHFYLLIQLLVHPESLHQIVASQDGGGSQTTPDSALDKVLQKLEELKLGIPQSCTDSLNTIVKDQLVLDRIKVLRNNYDLMLNWTGTEKKAFEDNIRKKALEKHISKQMRVYKQITFL